MREMINRFFNIKRFFIISLCLNAIFLLSFGYLYYRPNRIKQFKQMIFQDKSKLKPKYKPNYYTQKNHFETLPDGKNEIIFLGDSITDFGRWSEMFQNTNIKNRGIRADLTDGVLERLGEVVRSSPDKIFIMIGINDLSSKRKIAEIVSNYDNILQFIRKKSSRTRIFVQSVLPVNENIPHRLGHAKNSDVMKLNAKLRGLCAQYGIKFIDLFPLFANEQNMLKEEFTFDGLHPNGKGYLVWKSAIEKYVSE
jgi:lysophospholipase L1-like esterase